MGKLKLLILLSSLIASSHSASAIEVGSTEVDVVSYLSLHVSGFPGLLASDSEQNAYRRKYLLSDYLRKKAIKKSDHEMSEEICGLFTSGTVPMQMASYSIVEKEVPVQSAPPGGAVIQSQPEQVVGVVSQGQIQLESRKLFSPYFLAVVPKHPKLKKALVIGSAVAGSLLVFASLAASAVGAPAILAALGVTLALGGSSWRMGRSYFDSSLSYQMAKQGLETSEGKELIKRVDLQWTTQNKTTALLPTKIWNDVKPLSEAQTPGALALVPHRIFGSLVCTVTPNRDSSITSRKEKSVSSRAVVARSYALKVLKGG